MQAILITFIILLLITFGHSTFIRNYAWKTEESLWLDAVDKYPNLIRPQNNLANYYYVTGQTERALEKYHFALKLKEASHGDMKPLIHYNMALAYNRLNEDKVAIMHYKKAIETSRRFFLAPYNNLTLELIKQGEFKEALSYISKVLAINPTDWKLHNNLGLLLLKEQRFDEAILEFQKAIDLDETALISMINLGIAYKNRGYLKKSIRCFRKVLSKTPDALYVYLHLAEAYILKGQEVIAERIIAKILDRTPPKFVNDLIKQSFQEHTLKILPNRELILPYIKAFYCTRLSSY